MTRELVKSRVIDQEKVIVMQPDGKKAVHRVARIEGAWHGQDYTTFKEGKTILAQVICPFREEGSPEYRCSIFDDKSIVITEQTGPGRWRVASFPSAIKTIDEARKLLPAIIRGDLKKSPEYRKLFDQLA